LDFVPVPARSVCTLKAGMFFEAHEIGHPDLTDGIPDASMLLLV
jgi:hypothetical protein